MMLSKEALETSPEAVLIFRKYTIRKNYRNTNTAGIYNDLMMLFQYTVLVLATFHL